jgi:hypothetical protein
LLQIVTVDDLGAQDVGVGEVVLAPAHDRATAAEQAEVTAALAIEECGEYRGRIEARQAQPLDRRGRCDERDQPTVADRTVIEASVHTPSVAARLPTAICCEPPLMKRPFAPAAS